MDILIFLIPIALLLGLIGLVGFLWSIRNKQFDDLDGAASRILTQNDRVAPQRQDTKEHTKQPVNDDQESD